MVVVFDILLSFMSAEWTFISIISGHPMISVAFFGPGIVIDRGFRDYLSAIGTDDRIVHNHTF
jgi:hypothetical protein